MIQYYAMPGLKFRNQFIIRSDRATSCLTEIALCLNIPVSAMMIRTRKRRIVDARSIAIHFLRERLNLTLRSIADMFKLDHSTIIWALKRCKNLMHTDPGFMAKVEYVDNNVY